MGVFENFPYTNFHEMNLDWIVTKVKEVITEWIEYKESVDAEITEFRTWFDNLDVQDEVRVVINEMVASGEFLDVTEDTITTTVTAWLAEHITPTTPIVDDTLTISGAAADAKVTGDRISDLKEDLGCILTPVMETGKAIGNAGNPYNNALCACSDYLPVEPGSAIKLENVDSGENLGCFFYNADKTLLSKYTDSSGISITIETIVPENAYYIRLTSRIAVQPYLTYQNLYNNYIYPAFTLSKDNAKDITKIYEGVTPYAFKIASSSDLSIIGKAVNSTTGELTNAGSAWVSTDFIDLYNSSEKLTAILPTFTGVNAGGMAFYDSEKTYISGVAGRASGTASYEAVKIDVPDNAKYARFSIRIADQSAFYVETGSLLTLEDEVNSALYNTYAMQMFEKVGVIGDSISVGWGSANSRRNTGISWPQQMARRLGCTAYNLGASGVDPIEWFDPTFEFAQYCYTQYQSVGFCDLYIIGLGLNGGTIGSIADINESDYTQNANTFYGQYARIIQMINHDHPKAIVLCITEPTTAISGYDQAVRNICGLSFINAQLVDLELDYFDLFNNDAINAEHTPDGIHYTPYGYSLIADAMAKAISDYISKNPEPFKNVGIA